MGLSLSPWGYPFSNQVHSHLLVGKLTSWREDEIMLHWTLPMIGVIHVLEIANDWGYGYMIYVRGYGSMAATPNHWDL